MTARRRHIDAYVLEFEYQEESSAYDRLLARIKESKRQKTLKKNANK